MPPDPSSPPAFYYLSNFERALAWLVERYDDVLDADEHAFVAAFYRLPRASRALLVRMLMRKGPIFRASKLVYDEIGCSLAAAAPLVELGWIDREPALALDELFALATKPELRDAFPDTPASGAIRKADWLDTLRAAHDGERTWAQWLPSIDDRVLRVTVDRLCNRLRLMFFGNLHQDWSEFVLADLGLLQYETVAFAPSSRAFQRRGDVDTYLQLHACREQLERWPEETPLAPLVAAAAAIDCGNAWLAMRRAKLSFAIGQACERRADWDGALAAYESSAWPGSRQRRVRVLERGERFDAAFALADEATRAPENEAEAQQIARMLPRLRRRVGLPATRAASAASAQAIPRDCIELAHPGAPYPVEYVARDHLSRADAPVFYVENTLINSLFGLLCWEPVFAAVPGAFFHPFQRGPADLHAPDFRARRATQFDACLAQLDGPQYRDTIRRHYAQKTGVQSPFVFWGALDDALLEHALACLPAEHLRLWFERLLDDVRGNRSGLPDLVRFWPDARRYELIEVKGPGDRLQDNQIRWLDYCVRHRMPVRVLDVRWAGNAHAPHDEEALA
ncbi:VRR-NUC domain-containing protein [Burkholderia mayonis]|uniref:phosphodiesterase I n=1 Tax=Burkholderia mayonis TaxID=1385591 RepID=A0A1B4FTF0_9BURK|nr:VRR-NUC domain-containing protein [Burkholderia mayonis]AOJ06958.1 nuclease [Burkholderia mayonis]KVE58966.1 nuclease [Burkholderia mayonis]